MKPRKRYIEIVKGEIINFRVTNTLKSRKCVRVLQQLNPFSRSLSFSTDYNT